MRNLSLTEMDLISGGGNCIDYATWENLHIEARDKALSEGALIGLIPAAALGGITAAFLGPFAIAPAAVGYAMGFRWGYMNSSAWSYTGKLQNT